MAGASLSPTPYSLQKQLIYEDIFSELDSFGVSPQTVHCDYEMALLNGSQKIWSTATTRGCYFYYMQCLWRNFQHHHHAPEYAVLNSPVRRAYKLLSAMPFVFLGDVTTA